MIDLTILGTAATMPLPDRALSSVLMKCHGKTVLFDCGEGTQSAARKAQVSLMKTELIAFTHFHGDHLFGLPGLLQTMACMGRTDKLDICGPEGLERVISQILALTGPLPFKVQTIQAGTEGIPFADGILRPFPVNHRVPAWGYSYTLPRSGKFDAEAADRLQVPLNCRGRLQNGQSVEVDGKLITPEMVLGPARKGLKVVISGDTAPCGNLTDSAKDADVLICDATYGSDDYLEEARIYGHSTFSQAARTAKEAGAERLLLMHFSQMMECPEDYLENAKSVFDKSECAQDGMKIQLNYTEE